MKASRWPGHAGRPHLVLLTSVEPPAQHYHRPPLVLLQGGAGGKDVRKSHPNAHIQHKASARMRVAREAVSTNFGMATDDAKRATRLLIADLLRLGGTDDLLARRLSRLLSTSQQEARKPQR